MRVLITNLLLWPVSGTVTVVRDLALGLKARGHTPAVFSLDIGPIADQLRASGVPVVSRLGRLPWRPDVIHGHHGDLVRLAIDAFPGVPAINVCHGHASAFDGAVHHPAVRRYFAVSEACRRRQLSEGVPEHLTDLLPNAVDTARFQPRPPLPATPRRALVFSNYAADDGDLDVVRRACAQAGLTLDVAGAGVGAVADRPELVLPRYDVVFAKARAALEAMAVGAAVVLCDYGRAGPLVHPRDFERLQGLNFGSEAIDRPLTVSGLLEQLARYDAADAARVQALVRSRASLDASLDRLERVYEACLAHGAPAGGPAFARRRDRWRARAFYVMYWRWLALSPQRRSWLGRLGLTAPGRAWASRVLNPRDDERGRAAR